MPFSNLMNSLLPVWVSNTLISASFLSWFWNSRHIIYPSNSSLCPSAQLFNMAAGTDSFQSSHVTSNSNIWFGIWRATFQSYFAITFHSQRVNFVWFINKICIIITRFFDKIFFNKMFIFTSFNKISGSTKFSISKDSSSISSLNKSSKCSLKSIWSPWP